jgi:hypothetical protein
MSAILESVLTDQQRAEADAADRKALAQIKAYNALQTALKRPSRCIAAEVSEAASAYAKQQTQHEGATLAEREHIQAVYELATLRAKLTQKDKDLREAVQALQDRARDAFDCGRNLDQDALEAAWDDEAPEDYAQFKRLWWGAQA